MIKRGNKIKVGNREGRGVTKDKMGIGRYVAFKEFVCAYSA